MRGTSFAVWAPRAKAVRVIGDFNDWDGRIHPMRLIGSSGVWELFVPDVGVGTRLQVRDPRRRRRRAHQGRPDGAAHRVPAATPARSSTHSGHEWADTTWMTERTGRDPHNGPMSVYEVHLGSWRQGLSYRDLAEHLVNYVSDLGFTHVELLPVMEHPYGPSWGYQVTGYYAPTARFGTPDDFKYLVDTLHQAGIGVILDWVPGHFPRDAFALARFDGLPLYEHPDPRRGDQPDWGTHVFDFGRLEVRNFLVANAHLLAARSSTSTGCGSTPSPRCSTSTTRARTASGSPTCTAAASTSRRSACSRRPTPRPTSGCPASSRSPRSRPRGPASPRRPRAVAWASG